MKTKLKMPHFTEVTLVRFSWLGRMFPVQTYDEAEDDYIEQSIQEIESLLQHEVDTGSKLCVLASDMQTLPERSSRDA